MVLAHVTSRLHTLVSTLTVQIFKDDWMRPPLVAGSLPGGVLVASDYSVVPGAPAPAAKPAEELDPLTSTPAKPSSPPPEFSFNTPGKSINPATLPMEHFHRPHNLGLAYGAAAYNSAFGQGTVRPGSGLGMGAGLGVGVGLSPTQAFRTALGPAPYRYGAQAPPTQFTQFRP